MIWAFVTYAIIWLGVAWYVFNIQQQHQKLARQVEALEAAVASGTPVQGSGAGTGARRA